MGQARAFKNKWISKEGAGLIRLASPSSLQELRPNGRLISAQIENPVDETAEQLRTISQTGTHPAGDAVTKELVKRKLITPKWVLTPSGASVVLMDESGNTCITRSPRVRTLRQKSSSSKRI